MDFASAAPGVAVTALDQPIGTGDGGNKVFQLVKVYGSAYAPWTRVIAKPVAGRVLIAVGGMAVVSGWAVDLTTGLVTFTAAPTRAQR